MGSIIMCIIFVLIILIVLIMCIKKRESVVSIIVCAIMLIGFVIFLFVSINEYKYGSYEELVTKYGMIHSGTSKYSNEELIEIIKKNFDLTPTGIIKTLDLLKPIYKSTTNYGHFGKFNLPWEQIIKLKI